MVDVVKSCIESDKEALSCDDLILPGFRFHPTDEELVGFYLRRKLQLRPLPVELIKQVDIYKYEPWDLPKLASTGEKEWYFYCPRDRKYRNSHRPNRVTGSGFWKATGTDRPIYSSDGSKCIGLKKSLVFYRGRAARGVKTDWMMHEFRLPTEATAKKTSDKNLPPNDSWAICRIFKKANSAVNRALLAQSWQTPSTTSPHAPYISSTNHDFQHPSNFSAALKASPILTSPDNNNNDYFRETTADFTSMILNLSPGLGLVDSKSLQMQLNGHSNNSSNTLRAIINMENHQIIANSIRSMGFPFNLSTGPQDSWDSPPCPSEISSTNYSADKYYT